MNKDKIGPRIKKFRIDRSLTQAELARALGYSDKSVITHIEKGDKEMSYEKILLLLRTFSLDANDLFEVKRIDKALEEHRRKEREREGYEKDILFELNDMIFSYRIGGVLIKDNQILLTKGDEDDYSLPGGHVQIGETSKDAIAREFKEETGFDVEVVNNIATFENFFQMGDEPCHQICLFYRLKMIDENQTFKPEPDTSDTHFVWFPIDQLHEINLYPIGIKEEIIKKEVNNHHFIYKE